MGTRRLIDVDDDLWRSVKAQAKTEGRTITAVIGRFLTAGLAQMAASHALDVADPPSAAPPLSKRDRIKALLAAKVAEQTGAILTPASSLLHEHRSPDGDGHARPSFEPSTAVGQSVGQVTAKSEAGSEPADALSDAEWNAAKTPIEDRSQRPRTEDPRLIPLEHDYGKPLSPREAERRRIARNEFLRTHPEEDPQG